MKKLQKGMAILLSLVLAASMALADGLQVSAAQSSTGAITNVEPFVYLDPEKNNMPDIDTFAEKRVSDMNALKNTLAAKNSPSYRIILDSDITGSFSEYVDHVFDVNGIHILDLNGHKIDIANVSNKGSGQNNGEDRRDSTLVWVNSGAKLYVIDSSENQNGQMKYDAYMPGTGKDELKYICARNIFEVKQGAYLAIYAGTFTAGREKSQDLWRAEQGGSELTGYSTAHQEIYGNAVFVNGGTFRLFGGVLEGRGSKRGSSKGWSTQQDTCAAIYMRGKSSSVTVRGGEVWGFDGAPCVAFSKGTEIEVLQVMKGVFRRDDNAGERVCTNRGIAIEEIPKSYTSVPLKCISEYAYKYYQWKTPHGWRVATAGNSSWAVLIPGLNYGVYYDGDYDYSLELDSTMVYTFLINYSDVLYGYYLNEAENAWVDDEGYHEAMTCNDVWILDTSDTRYYEDKVRYTIDMGGYGENMVVDGPYEEPIYFDYENYKFKIWPTFFNPYLDADPLGEEWAPYSYDVRIDYGAGYYYAKNQYLGVDRPLESTVFKYSSGETDSTGRQAKIPDWSELITMAKAAAGKGNEPVLTVTVRFHLTNEHYDKKVGGSLVGCEEIDLGTLTFVYSNLCPDGCHTLPEEPVSIDAATRASTYECTVCGAKVVVPFKMVEHDTHEWVEMKAKTVEPTCTKTGSKTFTCAVEGCDALSVETIPALGHLYTVQMYTKATCTTEGKGQAGCSRCGTYTQVFKEKTPHNLVKVEGKSATLKKDGWRSFQYCTECGVCWDIFASEDGDKSMSVLGEKAYYNDNYYVPIAKYMVKAEDGPPFYEVFDPSGNALVYRDEDGREVTLDPMWWQYVDTAFEQQKDGNMKAVYPSQVIPTDVPDGYSVTDYGYGSNFDLSYQLVHYYSVEEAKKLDGIRIDSYAERCRLYGVNITSSDNIGLNLYVQMAPEVVNTVTQLYDVRLIWSEDYTDLFSVLTQAVGLSPKEAAYRLGHFKSEALVSNVSKEAAEYYAGLMKDTGASVKVVDAKNIKGELTSSLEVTDSDGVSTSIPLNASNVWKDETTGEIYYKVTLEVLPQKLNDPLKVCINVDGLGTTKTTELIVRDYLERVFANDEETYSDRQVGVAAAILYYGSAAQEYLEYQTDDLACSNVEEAVEQRIEERGASLGKVSELAAYAPTVSGKSDKLTYTGSSLVMKNHVFIRHYFSTQDAAYAKSCGLTAAGSENLYYVEQEIIYPADFDVMTDCTVSGITVRYCVFSYIRQVLLENQDSGLVKMCKALYTYYYLSSVI